MKKRFRKHNFDLILLWEFPLETLRFHCLGFKQWNLWLVHRATGTPFKSINLNILIFFQFELLQTFKATLSCCECEGPMFSTNRCDCKRREDLNDFATTCHYPSMKGLYLRSGPVLLTLPVATKSSTFCYWARTHVGSFETELRDIC